MKIKELFIKALDILLTEKDDLISDFETIKLEEVEQSIAEKQAHQEMVEKFLSELAKRDAITEFTDELWYSMIDCVTVFTKDDIRFTFKNGTEINLIFNGYALACSLVVLSSVLS